MTELMNAPILIDEENYSSSNDMSLKSINLINTHLERTCEVIIQHLKNVVLFQTQIDEWWGYHSRFMERMLHPEDKLIFKGTSEKLLKNGDLPRRKEHIVPMSFLLNGLWELIEKDQHTDSQLVQILKKNLGIAYITQDEAQKLDSKLSGLKTSMPKDWSLENGDPLDRLKAMGIILIDKRGKEVITLTD